MLLANRAAERLTGAHPGQYARKTLPESALAGETPPLAGLQRRIPQLSWRGRRRRKSLIRRFDPPQ
jgi:hypothetical protein